MGVYDNGKTYITGVSITTSIPPMQISTLEADAEIESPWVDGAWTYRKKITISSDMIDGSASITLPIKITLSGDEDLFAAADSAGEDIVVTDADGVVLYREPFLWDPSAEYGVIYFEATLTPDEDNVFYLYVGNPSTSYASAFFKVWEDRFTTVRHRGFEVTNVAD